MRDVPITQEFASLLAQVFPAVLIAMILESRVMPRTRKVNKPVYWAASKLAFQSIRYLASAGTAVSIFLCLAVAAGAPVYPAVYWTIWISLVLITFSFCLTIGTMAYDHCHVALVELIDELAKKKESAEQSQTSL
jgi:hypothetical protein